MNNKTLLLFTLILLTISSCNKESARYTYSDPIYRTTSQLSDSQFDVYYSKIKLNVAAKNLRFKEEYARSNAAHQNTLIKLSKNYIYTTLKDTIFPSWYDTKWDYNGTTETPRSGKIACGYFVTTTLRDVGFRINRVSMAQQASSNIIKSMCGANMHVIGHNNIDALESYLLKKQDGIFIIGLDNHVGFIVKEGESLQAVHSNGISGSLKVVKEPMKSCKLILKSQAFYIGDLMASSQAFKSWIRNESIATVR